MAADKDNNYYNKQEKIKILQSYLGSLFTPPSQIGVKKYRDMKNQLAGIKRPLTKLIVSRNITYLKLAASILLTHNLAFPTYELIDIDTLMNLWLGYDVGKDKDNIKTCDVLIILSFGSSFFKNTKGLFESVVQKRQFDGLSTIVLTTVNEKNISSVFEKADIVEFKRN